MGLRKELLALAFGVLLVLVTFGDNHLGNIAGVPIGNLDTIFGLAFWPVLDVLYPLATIAVFVLHGWNEESKMKLKSAPTLFFSVFIILLALMNLDDLVLAFNHLGLNLTVQPPQRYWIIISWLYPIYSAAAFFLFEKMLKNRRNAVKT